MRALLQIAASRIALFHLISVTERRFGRAIVFASFSAMVSVTHPLKAQVTSPQARGDMAGRWGYPAGQESYREALYASAVHICNLCTARNGTCSIASNVQSVGSWCTLPKTPVIPNYPREDIYISPRFTSIFFAWGDTTWNYAEVDYGPCDPRYQWNCESDEERPVAKALGVPQVCEGNPCDVVSGNKWQLETDYKGSGPFPLLLERTYNSRDASVRSLGPNWIHSYERRLFFAPHALAPTEITALRGDGRKLVFKLVNGRWFPEMDRDEQLSASAQGWMLVDSSGTSERFDVGGRLRVLTDRLGRTQTLTYSADDRLEVVTDQFGRQLRFQWDGIGSSAMLSGVVDPAGSVIRYEHDSRRLSRVAYPDGTTRTFFYGEAHTVNSRSSCPNGDPSTRNLLTGINDSSGRRYANWAYDCFGRVIASRNGTYANALVVDYVSPSIRNVTDALGTRRTYRLATSVGRGVLEAIDGLPVDRPKAQRHDTRGNVIERTDWNDVRTSFVHEPVRNLVIRKIEADGASLARTTTTQWHSLWRVPVRVAEPKRITTYEYDESGTICGAPGALCAVSIQATSDASGAAGFDATRIGEARRTSFTYNAAAQVTSIDGPRTDVNDVARIEYDTIGNVAAISDALGRRTRFTRHDAHGNVLESVDPNGLVTRLAYDARQQLTSRTIGALTTGYVYDGEGLLVRLNNPDGTFVEFTYDDAHRLSGMRDGTGARVAYQLDGAGNRLKTELFAADGTRVHASESRFDAIGRLAESVSARGLVTRHSYDAQGNRTGTTDPLGNITTFGIDALARIATLTDALGGVVRLGYDGVDRLFAVADPRGITTGYDRDGLGNALRTVSPDAGTIEQRFDAAGNVIERKDARGFVTTITYDALGRPTSERTPLGRASALTTRFEYDAGAAGIGRLTGIAETHSRGSIYTGWSYDLQGRIIERHQTVGGVSLAARYGYDEASGRRIALTLPSGRNLGFRYGADGRVSAITLDGAPLIEEARAFPMGGPLASLRWASGASYARSFDADGRVAAFTIGASTRSISYDDAGRIVAIDDSAIPALSQRFAYDPLARLTGYLGYPTNQAFAYDANGNRRVLVAAGATFEQAIDERSNRLVFAASARAQGGLDYDAAGNIVGSPAWNASYDARGRLTGLFPANSSGSITYVVSRLGQRLTKRGPPTIVPEGGASFFYDEAGRLLGEYSLARQPVPRIEYVYWEDVPVAAIVGTGASTEIYSVWVDQLDTPRLLTDAQGRIRWRWESAPFGETPADEDPSRIGQPVTFNLRFPGQQFDRESGLHYNYFRDYDPSVGRYTTSDPIGLAGGINTYAYVAGNPTRFSDSLGLAEVDPFGDLPPGDSYPSYGTGEDCQCRGIANPSVFPPTAGLGKIAQFGATILGAPLVIGTVVAAAPSAASSVAVGVTAARAGVGAASAAAANLARQTSFDGPSAGLAYGNGRVCQVRFKSHPIFRMDYQPIPGSGGEPRLHIHLPPDMSKHWTIDPRSYRD